ncbi:hypothetical protein [Cognatishimia sp. F0-27]|uniref:hypothetical protein n=1 Tax=Cognatishimia sp. F0-27 TaxID=2816855 RepID=UPI001D0C7E08|nr:hypothetical protein [Cognatishimia sp. F0-27]MCC1494031.1 hypothetical protein [Cognatishimia sp. F0-27]
MSNVDDRLESVEEARALDARYQAARAALEHNRKIEQGQAGALFFAAMAYGDAMEENRMFQVAAHWAKLVCIASIFVIPNLLVISVLL